MCLKTILVIIGVVGVNKIYGSEPAELISPTTMKNAVNYNYFLGIIHSI